jgi:hypothetical protein
MLLLKNVLFTLFVPGAVAGFILPGLFGIARSGG